MIPDPTTTDNQAMESNLAALYLEPQRRPSPCSEPLSRSGHHNQHNPSIKKKVHARNSITPNALSKTLAPSLNNLPLPSHPYHPNKIHNTTPHKKGPKNNNIPSHAHQHSKWGIIKRIHRQSSPLFPNKIKANSQPLKEVD